MSCADLNFEILPLQDQDQTDYYFVPDDCTAISLLSTESYSKEKCHRRKISIPYEIHRRPTSVEHDADFGVIAGPFSVNGDQEPTLDALSSYSVSTIGDANNTHTRYNDQQWQARLASPLESRRYAHLHTRSFGEPDHSKYSVIGTSNETKEKRRSSNTYEPPTRSTSLDSRRNTPECTSVAGVANVPYRQQHIQTSHDRVLLRMIKKGPYLIHNT